MPKLGLYHDADPILLTSVSGSLTRAPSGKMHVRKDNLAGVTAPGVTDDSAAGYEAGSTWLDVTGGNFYVCKSAAAGGAVWLATVQSPVIPAGIGTELQYRNGASFGAITGSSWSGSILDLPAGSTVNGTAISVSGHTHSYEPVISTGTTAQYWRGDKSWNTLDKSAIGLGSVENTALSTWTGSANITTLGTITTGTWNAGAVTITSPAIATVPLSITGANGQTANLFNVTSYGGTAGGRLSVASTGATTINATAGSPLTVLVSDANAFVIDSSMNATLYGGLKTAGAGSGTLPMLFTSGYTTGYDQGGRGPFEFRSLGLGYYNTYHTVWLDAAGAIMGSVQHGNPPSMVFKSFYGTATSGYTFRSDAGNGSSFYITPNTWPTLSTESDGSYMYVSGSYVYGFLFNGRSRDYTQFQINRKIAGATGALFKLSELGVERMVVSATGDATFNGNVNTASDKAFYLGDPTTDGSWRFVRSGNNLVVERRESGAYVTKQTITA